MQESFEWKGYFSLPGSRQDALPGSLRFDVESGLELDIFGHFENYQGRSSRDTNLIVGFTEKGKEITLVNCFEYSRAVNLPGFPTSRFSAMHLLVGRHFSKVEELVFDYCDIEYTDLNYWIGISGFSKPDYQKSYNQATIRYERPEKISINPLSDWQIDFNFEYTGPMEFFHIKGAASLSQQTIVSLVPKTPANFEQFQKVYHHFSKFLCLNYFQHPPAKTITFFYKKEITKNDKQEHQKIEYFFGVGGQKNSTYKEHYDKTDFLLQYKDYDGELEKFLSAWFNSQVALEPTINMLSEALLKRGLPIEFYFTGMVQAFENLHRKTVCAADIRLRRRLEELLASLSPYLLKALLNDEADFLDRIIKNRNHYTHHESRDPAFVPASLSELFVVSEKLKILLIALLLQYMGMSQEQAARQILAKSVWLFNHVVKVSEAKEGFPDIENHF